MRTVELNAPGHGSMALTLRPLTGADELSLSGTGLGPAMALLARLSGSDPAGLSVSQIDRGLAGIYAMLYGETAECRASCARCGEAYEFALNLPGIIAAQDAERPGPPDDEGVWDMPGGARVRAPTPADLSGDPAALAAALTVAGSADPDAVAGFLDRAAPVLTLDLDAPCPACEAPATVRFDLAGYLTRRLAGERPFLVRETHLIASRYGWSHAEIMALTRDDRRAYAGLIEAERARLSRRQTA